MHALAPFTLDALMWATVDRAARGHGMTVEAFMWQAKLEEPMTAKDVEELRERLSALQAGSKA